MSRTLKQIELGSTVWIREGNTDADYILTRKDVNGVELLRKRAYTSRRMNPSNTTVYDGCELDRWLTNTETGFLSLFGAVLRSNLVNRSISTFTYGDSDYHYISRNCYLYSYGDMFLATPSQLYAEVNIVPALMANKGTIDANSARVCENNENTSAIGYWLRSAYTAAHFWNVNSNGATNYSSAASSCGVRPVLNVSPDTIVSDEDANIIYLLPEEKQKIIEFEGKVGESSARPKKVLVRTNSDNLETISLKVCNNYGDAVPTWETVTPYQETSLQNTIKQTANWVIGIKCHGEVIGLSNGYFEEPIILVEAE